MYRIHSDDGVTISYERQGSGAPLVLGHGGFSDHRTNWEFVMPLLARRFTVFTIARRGRGETDATVGHSVEEESRDVATLIRAIGERAFLLGHSHGAWVALGAASLVPGRVRKLVLYEPFRPEILGGSVPKSMVRFAEAGDWDEFSAWFFRNLLLVPAEEVQALRATRLWAPIVADAKATLGDLRALSQHEPRCDGFAELRMPVLLQVGSESPAHLYATERLAEQLADVRVESLAGQAHEGMTTAPVLYANAVTRFLTGSMEVSREPRPGRDSFRVRVSEAREPLRLNGE